MSVKKMAHIALLAALCVVLRLSFAAFPNIKPVTAFFLASLCYLPFLDSFLIMALSMLVSSILFGFSIVVAWQILSFGLLMVFWRYLVIPLTRHGRYPLVIQSGLAGLWTFTYGFWISIPIAIQYGVNLYIYWLNGLFFDFLHAFSTALFYPIIYLLLRRMYHDEKNFYHS